MIVIALTAGEPAGIGPDLCVRAAQRSWPARLVHVGDIGLLRERARRLDANVVFVPYRKNAAPPPGAAEVAHSALPASVRAGTPDVRNARAVLATLDFALEGCLAREFAAMVTAPVQKSVIIEAGVAFTGHTEFLAGRTRTPHVVMLLVGGSGDAVLRVALATTHLPLSAVPAAITRKLLVDTIEIVAHDLTHRFGIAAPRIAVCGLNPHAGEGGHLGREEIEVIAPALDALRARGFALEGPMPADTVFIPAHARRFDCIVALYHDQGLPVLKAASFGQGVNVTLGLPIVRTSVDHGTALDLAASRDGACAADPGSLFAAIELAIAIAQRRAA